MLEIKVLSVKLARELVCLIGLIILPVTIVAQGLAEQAVEAKSFRAVQVMTAPVVDGVLDDSVWEEAQKVTDFHQSRPGNRTEPSEVTELYVVYTTEALYIGARMYDR